MSTGTNQLKRNVKRVSVWFPLLLLLLVIGYYLKRAQDEAWVFEKCFSSRPESVRVVAVGYDRDIFGHSWYVIAFTISEHDIQRLVANQGYAATGISTDPGHWRLDLCNSVFKRLAKVDIQIDPTFLCYSRESEQNHARVFYDRNRNLAVVIGSWNKYIRKDLEKK